MPQTSNKDLPENTNTVEQRPGGMSQVVTEMQLAALEKPGAAAQKALYLIGGVLIVCLLWAGLSESDVCAEATGQLEPRTKIQVIRSAVDGTIRQFNVIDGQSVEAGQILVELNAVTATANLNKQKEQLGILQTQQARHVKAKAALERIIANPNEFTGKDLAMPEVDRLSGELYSAKKTLDRALYDTSTSATASGKNQASQMSDLLAQKEGLIASRSARQSAIERSVTEQAAQVQKLESRVKTLGTQVEKNKTELAEQEAAFADAKNEMAIYEKGHELGVASGVKYLEVQNYAHQRQFGVLQKRSQIAEVEQQLSAAKFDLQAAHSAYNANKADMMAALKAEDAKIVGVPLAMSDTTRHLEAQHSAFEVAMYHAKAQLAKEETELHKLGRKISEETASIELQEKLISERTIRAPIAGIVSQLTPLSSGEMVERGRELMTVVPTDKQLLLRAHVRSADIGFVEPGQEVRLRFTAFPEEEFGIIEGKVERVGNYPEESIEGKEKEATYRVNILPSQSWIGSGKSRTDLKIGLDVKADIVVRRRTLLQLLFEPFFKNS